MHLKKKIGNVSMLAIDGGDSNWVLPNVCQLRQVMKDRVLLSVPCSVFRVPRIAMYGNQSGPLFSHAKSLQMCVAYTWNIRETL
jgi:hypothetical protein